MELQQRRAAKAPTTRQPSFPGRPGLSQFERDLWRDVFVAVISSGGNGVLAAEMANKGVRKYQEFEAKMSDGSSAYLS